MQIQTPAVQGRKIASILVIMTSRKKGLPALNPSSRSTDRTSLIYRVAHCSSPHRIRLPPLEHHDEKKESKQTSDPAGGIPCLALGMKPKSGIKPKCGIKPKQTSPTLIETTNYRTRSGTYPLPSPAGYSGEEGVGLARRSWDDSQGVWSRGEVSRERVFPRRGDR